MTRSDIEKVVSVAMEIALNQAKKGKLASDSATGALAGPIAAAIVAEAIKNCNIEDFVKEVFKK